MYKSVEMMCELLLNSIRLLVSKDSLSIRKMRDVNGSNSCSISKWLLSLSFE